ncbi:hypothetical protein [Nitrosopumilus adriaticus]|uniref:hypothetical protein n=1 Tax=Nitrosopumilus adriaticus TaxID=1580092 RepID=UPI00352F30C0
MNCNFLLIITGFFILGIFPSVSGQIEINEPIQIEIIEQEKEFEFNWVGLGVIISGLGIAYSIYRGNQSSKTNEKIEFAKMMKDFENDLQSVLTEEVELQPSHWKENQEEPDKVQCRRVASDYLNILDRLAYLRKTGTIDDKIIDYFNWFYGYADAILLYKEKVDGDDRTKWPNILWWVNLDQNKDKIIPYPAFDLSPDMYTLFLASVGQTKT